MIRSDISPSAVTETHFYTSIGEKRMLGCRMFILLSVNLRSLATTDGWTRVLQRKTNVSPEFCVYFHSSNWFSLTPKRFSRDERERDKTSAASSSYWCYWAPNEQKIQAFPLNFSISMHATRAREWIVRGRSYAIKFWCTKALRRRVSLPAACHKAGAWVRHNLPLLTVTRRPTAMSRYQLFPRFRTLRRFVYRRNPTERH